MKPWICNLVMAFGLIFFAEGIGAVSRGIPGPLDPAGFLLGGGAYAFTFGLVALFDYYFKSPQTIA